MSSRSLRDQTFDFPDPSPSGDSLDTEVFETLGLLKLPLCVRSMIKRFEGHMYLLLLAYHDDRRNDSQLVIVVLI